MQLAAFTTDHFPLGQAAMQVNEGLPAYIVSALERRYGGLHGQDRRHPRDGLQGRVGRPARIAQLQAAQAAVVGRRPRPLHRPVRGRRPPGDPRLRPRGERHPRSSARRTRPIATSRSAARTSSTCGAPSARGSGSSARSSSPAPPGSSTATSSRSCSRPATRSSASTTSASTAGWSSRTTTIRATGSSRATPRTPALMRELAADCDQVVAAAAMIGGISYFHEFAYDLLAENERILALDLRRARSPPIATVTSSGSSSSAARWSTSRRRSSRPPRAPS